MTGEAGLYFARLKNMAVWYAAMGVFALVAVIFLLIALFSWVAVHLGSIAAALIFAGVFLVLGIIAFVMARVSARPPRREPGDNRLERDIASIAGVTATVSQNSMFQNSSERRFTTAGSVSCKEESA